jgi:hypothetical protein
MITLWLHQKIDRKNIDQNFSLFVHEIHSKF